MFPHTWVFVGDIFKSSCEVISLQLEKKTLTQAKKKLLDMTSFCTDILAIHMYIWFSLICSLKLYLCLDTSHTYTVINTKLHSTLYTDLYTVLFCYHLVLQYKLQSTLVNKFFFQALINLDLSIITLYQDLVFNDLTMDWDKVN